MDCPNCQQPAQSIAPDRLVCKTCGSLIRDAKGEWHVDEAKTVVDRPAHPADAPADLPELAPASEENSSHEPGGPVPVHNESDDSSPAQSTPTDDDAGGIRFKLWDGDR